MPIDSSVWPEHRAEEVHASQIGEHEGGFAAFVLRKRRGSRQKSQRRDQET